MRARARSSSRRSAPAPSTSRSSTPARRSPAPRPTGCSPRRGCRATWPPAASCTWRSPAASTRSASTCTATTRRRPSSTTRSSAASAHRRRLVRRDRAAPRPRAARDAARHARDQADHARVHPDRAGGLEVRLSDRRRAAGASRPAATRGSSCAGCTRTSARRSSSWTCFEKLAEVLAGMGDWPLLNLGGGLGIAYTAEDGPPSIEEYAEALLRHASRGRDRAVRARAARWWATRA